MFKFVNLTKKLIPSNLILIIFESIAFLLVHCIGFLFIWLSSLLWIFSIAWKIHFRLWKAPFWYYPSHYLITYGLVLRYQDIHDHWNVNVGFAIKLSISRRAHDIQNKIFKTKAPAYMLPWWAFFLKKKMLWMKKVRTKMERNKKPSRGVYPVSSYS